MSAHLVTTPARRGHCPDCGLPVLAGIAEGLTAAVDPAPLDLHDALIARLAGRMTYDCVRTDGHSELVARDSPGRVAHRRWPVYAEHPHPAARHRVSDPGDDLDPTAKYRAAARARRRKS